MLFSLARFGPAKVPTDPTKHATSRSGVASERQVWLSKCGGRLLAHQSPASELHKKFGTSVLETHQQLTSCSKHEGFFNWCHTILSIELNTLNPLNAPYNSGKHVQTITTSHESLKMMREGQRSDWGIPQ